MTDESRHSVRRGRPLRTVTRVSTESRRRDNARRGAAAANSKPPVQQIDWDAAVARLGAMLDAMDYGE